MLRSGVIGRLFYWLMSAANFEPSLVYEIDVSKKCRYLGAAN